MEINVLEILRLGVAKEITLIVLKYSIYSKFKKKTKYRSQVRYRYLVSCTRHYDPL